MQILVMGGTRFVGKPLVARLKQQGHSLTLLTRGKNPVPDDVEHLRGEAEQRVRHVGVDVLHVGEEAVEDRTYIWKGPDACT